MRRVQVAALRMGLHHLVEIRNKRPGVHRLEDRMCELIYLGRRVLLRNRSGSYLHAHTRIEAGPDGAAWTRWRDEAMSIATLDWAFALAKLYECKVVSVGRHRRRQRSPSSG